MMESGSQIDTCEEASIQEVCEKFSCSSDGTGSMQFCFKFSGLYQEKMDQFLNILSKKRVLISEESFV